MISLEVKDGAGLRRLEDRLWPVYRQCFAAPPWNESAQALAAYPTQLARQTGYPGARGVVAWDGDALAGAAYGWPAPPTLPDANEFDRAVREAVSAETAALLVAPAVVLGELMVSPQYQQQGIGRRLLRAFIAGAPRAWLATHPDADAVRLYDGDGWVRRARCAVGDLPLVLFTREFSPAA